MSQDRTQFLGGLNDDAALGNNQLYFLFKLITSLLQHSDWKAKRWAIAPFSDHSIHVDGLGHVSTL